jgi:hypothetical protein
MPSNSKIHSLVRVSDGGGSDRSIVEQLMAVINLPAQPPLVQMSIGAGGGMLVYLIKYNNFYFFL